MYCETYVALGLPRSGVVVVLELRAPAVAATDYHSVAGLSFGAAPAPAVAGSTLAAAESLSTAETLSAAGSAHAAGDFGAEHADAEPYSGFRAVSFSPAPVGLSFRKGDPWVHFARGASEDQWDGEGFLSVPCGLPRCGGPVSACAGLCQHGGALAVQRLWRESEREIAEWGANL